MNNDEEKRIDGIWIDEDGEECDVHLKPEWRGHKWTDLEAKDLFDGKEVRVLLKSHAGNTYHILASLGHRSFTNSEGKVIKGIWVDGVPDVPDEWCKHKFTAKEKEALGNGQKVHCDDFVSKKGNKFECDVTYGEKEWQGRTTKGIIPHFKK